MQRPTSPSDFPEERPEASTRRSLSRRDFLSRTLARGAAGLGLPAVLAACGGDGENGNGQAAGTEAGLTAAECEGYDALTEADMDMRQSLEYVDNSPIPEQLCSNCQFYEPEASGPDCGGCLLFAGPVVPDGYCTSWIAQV